MLSYDEAIKFHGHNGPLLALGYKAGVYALKKLEPEGVMGLECSVETIGEKPYTCLIDGIQCSTCCTFGKCNIKLTDGEEIRVTFQNKKTNEKIILLPKENILKKALSAEDLEQEAEWIKEQPISSLFSILL